MGAADKIKSWLREQKDASVSFLMEKALQNYLERYGRVLQLQLDSGRNTARMEVLLKGELEPMTITIEEYAVTREREQTAVTIKSATASREWMTLLLREFVVGRPLPVPEKYATVTRLAL